MVHGSLKEAILLSFDKVPNQWCGLYSVALVPRLLSQSHHHLSWRHGQTRLYAEWILWNISNLQKPPGFNPVLHLAGGNAHWDPMWLHWCWHLWYKTVSICIIILSVPVALFLFILVTLDINIVGPSIIFCIVCFPLSSWKSLTMYYFHLWNIYLYISVLFFDFMHILCEQNFYPVVSLLCISGL